MEDVLTHRGVRVAFERGHDRRIIGFVLYSGGARNLRFVKQ